MKGVTTGILDRVDERIAEKLKEKEIALNKKLNLLEANINEALENIKANGIRETGKIENKNMYSENEQYSTIQGKCKNKKIDSEHGKYQKL